MNSLFQVALHLPSYNRGDILVSADGIELHHRGRLPFALTLQSRSCFTISQLLYSTSCPRNNRGDILVSVDGVKLDHGKVHLQLKDLFVDFLAPDGTASEAVD